MTSPDDDGFPLSADEEAGIEVALESFRQGRVVDAPRAREIINARVWAEEAQRRADALDAGSLTSRAAEDVFRDASLTQRARTKS
ncbi:MAG: hypothetical protein LAO77_02625 [Acidobacteriia bacterium]|nr:hypothetical protein [Terriglobia bacterium]